MTIDERLDRLTGVVEPLATSACARGHRIEALIEAAEKHEQEIKDLRTLPRQ